jgi:hypothetical protein
VPSANLVHRESNRRVICEEARAGCEPAFIAKSEPAARSTARLIEDSVTPSSITAKANPER